MDSTSWTIPFRLFKNILNMHLKDNCLDEYSFDPHRLSPVGTIRINGITPSLHRSTSNECSSLSPQLNPENSSYQEPILSELTVFSTPPPYHGQRCLVGCSPQGRRVGQDWVTSALTHTIWTHVGFYHVCCCFCLKSLCPLLFKSIWNMGFPC